MLRLGLGPQIASNTPPENSLDPYGADVSLLLHMNGSNGSTTFTDSSLNNFSVSAAGTAQISTAQYKYGGASGYFDGDGDYLSVADDDQFEFEGGDFCIECWIRSTDTTTGLFKAIMSKSAIGQDADGWLFYLDPNNELNFLAGNESWSVLLFSGFSPTQDTWHHIAATRSGDDFRLFFDGDLKASSTVSITLSTGSNPLYLAWYPYFNGSSSSNQSFNGYIDDIRITKGVARYTSNFTPPSSQFPNP